MYTDIPQKILKVQGHLKVKVKVTEYQGVVKGSQFSVYL